MHHRSALIVALLISPTLVACGDSSLDRDLDQEVADLEAQRDAADAAATSAAAAESAAAEAAAWPIPTMDEAGPTVCFDLVNEQIGTDLRVHEITSFFALGPDLEDPDLASGEAPPQGELDSCSIVYQDPDDELALLQRDLDLETGEFAEPVPLDLDVWGDPAEFDLDDYVMDLEQVDVSGLGDLLNGEEAAFDGVFSDYAWDRVWLSPPGGTSAEHEVRVDVTGLLETNGVEASGSLFLTPQGEVTLNNLTNF